MDAKTYYSHLVALIGEEYFAGILPGNPTSRDPDFRRRMDAHMAERFGVDTSKLDVDLATTGIGAHWRDFLKRVLPQVAEVDSLHVAEFPTGDFNARALPAPAGGYLILLDIGLAMTLSNVTKVLSSMVRSEKPGPNETPWTFQEKAAVVRRQLAWQVAHLGWRPDPLGDPYSHDRLSNAVYAWLLLSAEQFVVAHEVAHVLGGHLDESTLGRMALPDGSEIPFVQKSWNEELIADIAAVALLLSEMPREIRGETAQIEVEAKIAGIFLFFEIGAVLEAFLGSVERSHPPCSTRAAAVRIFLKERVPEQLFSGVETLINGFLRELIREQPAPLRIGPDETNLPSLREQQAHAFARVAETNVTVRRTALEFQDFVGLTFDCRRVSPERLLERAKILSMLERSDLPQDAKLRTVSLFFETEDAQVFVLVDNLSENGWARAIATWQDTERLLSKLGTRKPGNAKLVRQQLATSSFLVRAEPVGELFDWRYLLVPKRFEPADAIDPLVLRLDHARDHDLAVTTAIMGMLFDSCAEFQMGREFLGGELRRPRVQEAKEGLRAMVLEELAICSFYAGFVEDAIVHLKTVLELGERLSTTHFNLGKAYEALAEQRSDPSLAELARHHLRAAADLERKARSS